MRPSAESIVQLCADLWSEPLDNVKLTVRPHRNRDGVLIWRGTVEPGYAMPDDNRCFEVERETELETIARLYDCVCDAFYRSPQAHQIMPSGNMEPSAIGAYAVFDRRTGKQWAVFACTEDDAIEQACEVFGYRIRDFSDWNCSPRAVIRAVRAPMLDTYARSDMVPTDALNETIVVLTRAEAVRHHLRLSR